MARLVMDETTRVGTVEVVCRECGVDLPIDVSAFVTVDDDGDLVVRCESDVDVLWQHQFEHEVRG